MLWEKLEKSLSRAVLPEFPNFISFSPKYVFHQGPLTPRGWQTNYSHIVLVFIKKHLTDYFISTLITNYTIVLFTQDFKYDSHKCVIASIFLLSVNTQNKNTRHELIFFKITLQYLCFPTTIYLINLAWNQTHEMYTNETWY